MPTIQRYSFLLLIGLISACMNLPEVEGTQPDAGTADTVRPSLTRSEPAHNTSGIALDTGLEFEFSEPMDVDTVQVSISPSVGLGAPRWSAGGTRLNLQLLANLAPNTTYTVTVAGRDVAGNTLTGTRSISFATVTPVDTVSPSIARSLPAHGSSHIALDTGLEFEFSEPMSTSTVQVSISPTVQFGAPMWSAGNTRLNRQLLENLAPNTTYTLTVTGRDVAGNELTGLRVISFSTTGPAPDTTPPEPLAYLPTNQATGVDRTTSIMILFSEPMDKASVQSAFALTAPSGFGSGTFNWNESGTEMTYRPNADFAYGVDVNWRISTGAKDLAGNTLQAAITGTFRIVRITTVTVAFDPFTTGSLNSPHFMSYPYIEATAYVGDTYDNSSYRLFLGFRLNSLPDNLKRITRGTLKWWITAKQGDPFVNLGDLLLEPVNIGESLNTSLIDAPPNQEAVDDYYALPLGSSIYVRSDGLSPHGIFNVTTFLTNDWQSREFRNKRTQYRLRFERGSNNDRITDILYCGPDSTPKIAELDVTYEYD